MFLLVLYTSIVAMSHIFRSCDKIPHINEPWMNWFTNMSSKNNQIFYLYRTIVFFKKRTEELIDNIPSEIWNSIVWHICGHTYIDMRANNFTPDRWSNNLFKWLDYWSTYEQCQKSNSLVIGVNSIELTKPGYIKNKYEADGIGLLTQATNISNNFVCPNVGYILGISFRDYDVSNIKKCELFFNSTNLGNLQIVFDEDHKLKFTVIHRDTIHTFWKCAELQVIPLCIMSFIQLTVKISLKDETYTPNSMFVLNYFPSDARLTKHPIKYEHSINKNETLIFGGGSVQIKTNQDGNAERRGSREI